MNKLTTSHDDQSVLQLDDETLNTVVGGALADALSPQLALAYNPVGGWTMRDVFARPVLGRYTPQ